MPSATGWSGNSPPSGRPTGWSSTARPAALDDAETMRHAGRDLLSLALLDARNGLLAALEEDDSPEAARWAVRAGWWADHWIARHMQCSRGEACDPDAPRLASADPCADAWAAGELPPPEPEALRAYLADTLETVLDLLAKADDTDQGLHFFRAALWYEDRCTEALRTRLRSESLAPHAERPPLLLPAQRVQLGRGCAGPGLGFVPWFERGEDVVNVPESEIDAQPVNWTQFAEFVADGGYDRAEFWSGPGRAWLEGSGARAPSGIEQLGGAVLLLRGPPGREQTVRAFPGQMAVRVNRHEAEAWCAWAGRRLPTEPEWVRAVDAGTRQGFVWGQAWEWVAGSARAHAGAGEPPPAAVDVPGQDGATAVLVGGSHLLARRWVSSRTRRCADPADASILSCFRSCAW